MNIMRAHAAAYHAIHELQPHAQVGLAHHIIDWQPWRPWFPGDRVATNMVRHIFQDLILGTIIWGTMRIPGRRTLLMPEVAKSLDWLGVNYYQRYRVRLKLLFPGQSLIRPVTKPGEQKGPGEWGEIHPRGLFEMLRSLWKRYRLPLIVTENGIPDETDANRPRFIVTHVHQLWEAIRRGIPVKGYYFWSLVDNFEWTEGYDPRFRFGLIGVDFKTQERHIRPSGHLYAEICKHGGLRQELVEQYTPELLTQVFAPSRA
jgi:beta-glucosidase